MKSKIKALDEIIQWASDMEKEQISNKRKKKKKPVEEESEDEE